MHRSGTSLLTKILSNYIFIGSKVDFNNESIYFQRLNRWLLSSNSCSWDNPTSFDNLNKDELYILNKKLKNNINKKIPTTLYFGIKNIIYNNNFFNLKYKWGWKDPVNVFTLSLWNKIFSNFKVININRNPLDVSQSLLNRQKTLVDFDNTDVRFKDKQGSLGYLKRKGSNIKQRINDNKIYNNFFITEKNILHFK